MSRAYSLSVGAAIFFICAAILAAKPTPSLSQGAGTALTGYAWSDTIGWVSLHCSNHGTCGTSNYGLAIDSDGLITGYAWSEHLGWISANASDLSGCPSGTCTARFDDYNLAGWMRAIGGGGAQSGGWDGFISLSGATYGPTLSAGSIDGYAWGSDVVGWLDFASGVHAATTSWTPTCATTYQCVSTTTRQSLCQGAPVESCGSGQICSTGQCTTPAAPFVSPGDELTLDPQFIAYGDTVTITWNVQEADFCELSEDNPLIDQSISGAYTSVSTTSPPLTRPTTYTLHCTGPGGEYTDTATVSRRPDWREI